MQQSLKKSAQSVQNALNECGLSSRVIELTDTARTAEQAAEAIACNVSQIVKSLVFKTKNTNKAVLVLASGTNRVKEKIVQSELGEKIIKADADFVREVTGFAIGGVPPIGHKEEIEYIFIDQDLLKHDTVWAAAGTPHAVFNMKSNDLINMTSGKVISIN